MSYLCRHSAHTLLSFKYNQNDGSFVGITDGDLGPLVGHSPPDNCPVCARREAEDSENYPQSILGGKGIAFRGVDYHVNDFAMIKTRDATCMIAQIAGFTFDDSARSQGTCMLTVEPVGRINDILHLYSGNDIIKDEVC